jgi:transposase
MKKVTYLSHLEKLQNSQVSEYRHFVNLATLNRLNAIRHLPDKEDLINNVWKKCLTLTLLMKKYEKIKKRIICMHEFPLKNKWTTFLDKLNISKVEEQNTLHIYLFQMLHLELISKEKDYRPFWTPVYKNLSEKLLSPTRIDLVDSDLTSSSCLSRKVVEKLQYSMRTEGINLQNKNYQKIYYQLSTSSVANKWEKEVTLQEEILKGLRIVLNPTLEQRKILEEWMDTSNYVYNKTIEQIKNGSRANFQNLRDLLVTNNTKKNNKEYKLMTEEIKILHSNKSNLQKGKDRSSDDTVRNKLDQEINKLKVLISGKNDELRKVAKQLQYEKNKNVEEWELNTPKDIRAGAVNDVCKAIKTGMTNLKNGNIKYFNLNFRKKEEFNKSVVIPMKNIKNTNGTIIIAPEYMKESFKMNKRTYKKYKNIEITCDCRIVKQKNQYSLIIPMTCKIEEKHGPVNYCGIDPGSRTFMTTFGNNGSTEYIHNKDIIKKINYKIKILKSNRSPKGQFKRNKCRKKQINKLEIRKSNIIDELHWKTINDLLNNNDFIFYGDIKSHGIVKNGSNKTLNLNINDLKLYKFKLRLLYKASVCNKKVFLVNESFTTKTCSCCGKLNDPGSSEVYKCTYCKKSVGRDTNASKNILMKGIINCL